MRSCCASIILVCLVPGVAATWGPGTIDSSRSTAAQLTVSRRCIDPPRLVVQRLDETGGYEILEIQPPETVLRVARTRRVGAAEWVRDLVAAGVFTWPDSTLLPPPNLDVDSDPIRFGIRTGDTVRVLSTRAPHVPPALQKMLDSLATLAAVAEPVKGCVVCLFLPVGRAARPPHVDLPEALLQELQRAESGPFPVVLSEEVREQLPEAPRTELAWPAAPGRLRVMCQPWQP